MQESFLDELSEGERLALPFLFEFWALEHQLPPEGDWRSWVIMGGRGAGKTRAGAEWVRSAVEGALPLSPGRCRRVALVGETLDQAREVMVFGDSGIMACSPPDRRPDWSATRRCLTWPNGAEAMVFSAHDPEALRGPQFDGAWADELGKWRKARESWDMLQFALRLGAQPQACVTTTPRNIGVLKELLELPSTVVSRAPTEANRANLAASFLDEVRARYGATRLARQELDGEMVCDVDGTLWTQEMLERARLRDRPGRMDRIVVAVDPPAGDGAGSDACGIVVCGVQCEGPPQGWEGFVLEDASVQGLGPTGWAQAAEMRALTQVRGASGFPAVAALRALAAECRALLGPEVRIGYAADWSEYFGYHPQDGSGDVYFHLDPLWSDSQIDFIGIDNYMPLADWRDGDDHADADWGSIYNPDYLMANVAGGEGFDWYYPSAEARAAQRREAITDGAHGEPWVYRYKDLRGWWSNLHHERIGGVRQEQPTGWEPQSKPIWFTELGCAAVDMGANQPNKFLDPKSSESDLPYYSNGLRDELMQRQYLRAIHAHWNDPANNPLSDIYGAPMLDMSRALVWAWDARPFPWFPGLADLWSDGGNYRRGHWLNGRCAARTLASVVAEVCAGAGLTEIDVSRLWGWVRGYHLGRVSDARATLQPLLLAHGVDAIERDGVLRFLPRRGRAPVTLDPAALVHDPGEEADLQRSRAGAAEVAGRLRLRFIEEGGDHPVTGEEVVLPDAGSHAVAETEMPMLLTRAEGRQVLERWLAEARIARETLRFALPPSRLGLGAGDIIELPAAAGPLRARIDRVESGSHQKIEAVRIEPDTYLPAEMAESDPLLRPFAAPVPVQPLFLDLPLMSGEEVEHAPHLAVDATPWPGSVAVYDAATDADYQLNEVIVARAAVGVTETPLAAAPPGRIDRGAGLQIALRSGALQSVPDEALLGGANLVAIGDGSPGNWELLQFRDAQLLEPGRWLVSHRLRGQAGSDGIMPAVWPAGSWVVLLDGAPQQIALAPAQRRLARHYRIGPARRSYDDPVYQHLQLAFDGNGLRPYRPAHLRAARAGGTALALSWIRRTRLDGDDWERPEVPLGEESEFYLLRIVQSGAVIREAFCTQAAFVYDPALDGLAGSYEVRVAQVSARYGPGPFTALLLAA